MSQQDLRTVTPSSWVRLAGFEPDQEETWYLVDDAEVDPQQNRISPRSPLGEVLVGAQVGDRVRYETPGGEVELLIIDTGPT